MDGKMDEWIVFLFGFCDFRGVLVVGKVFFR